MKLPKCFYSKGANTKIAITLVNGKLRANDRKLRDLCRPGKINDQKKLINLEVIYCTHKGKRKATDG